MYSSNLKPHGALAGQLKLLRQFANLRDEDVERFGTEHPDFVVSKALTDEGWVEGVVHRLGGGGPRLVSAKALRLAQIIKDQQPNAALRKRDMLRAIWRGDDSANDYLKILLSGSRMEFDWKRAELTYAPENDFERAIYVLFRNSHLAKICGNADCPVPYFVAKRQSQVYCDEDCAEKYQKEWKLNWWKEIGSKKRKEQRAKRRKRRCGSKSDHQ
jgi:hypothetical protein